jgi:hypothetical protein
VNVTEPVGVPDVPVTVAESLAVAPLTVGVVFRLADGVDGGGGGGGVLATLKGSHGPLAELYVPSPL